METTPRGPKKLTWIVALKSTVRANERTPVGPKGGLIRNLHLRVQFLEILSIEADTISWNTKDAVQIGITCFLLKYHILLSSLGEIRSTRTANATIVRTGFASTDFATVFDKGNYCGRSSVVHLLLHLVVANL